ncbi:MAG: RNA polymerase factor sigma-54 [Gammaproteobacteria bacterium]|nr:RNA polymerase factor sigma-54 [Gammaproteobacteria bacterium]
MKQSLQLRIGQSLTMTPQLQQAIRLLQLSTLELQTEIQEALESNPMLEVEEEGQNDDPLNASQNEQKQDELNNKEHNNTELDSLSDKATENIEIEAANVDINDNQEIPDDLPVDSNWDDIYDIPPVSSAAGGDDDKAREFLENQSNDGDALIDHLLWQLQLTPMSDTDRAIAMTVIDGIDDDGYLKESAEDIFNGLVNELEIEMDEVEAVIHRIQRFDPLGVGARDLKECLLLQLENFTENDIPRLKKIRSIIQDHLDLLGSHDYAKLKRYTRMSEEELAAVISFIQTLNPRPGALIAKSSTQYVVPDVFVRKEKGRWVVELNPDTAPKLRVNPLYASFIKRGNQSDDNTFMKNNMQEARWFIKSLQSRNETLMRVATSIVEHQRTFLEYGDEGMKPLVLRDIAEELELHESTISRVTTQKYMHTPAGVFEFKYFFSSHVGTSDGGECSATAIRAMIKKLINKEDPKKPMSDNKLAGLLVDQGINVARRTVAKYREAMMIPPSNERKRLT